MSEIALYAFALLCYAGLFAIFLNVLGDCSEDSSHEPDRPFQYPPIVDDPEGRN